MSDGPARRPVALVTGSTSGLGLCLARRLEGRYRLILAGRRDRFPGPLPEGAIYVAADQADPHAASQAIETRLAEAGIDRLNLAFLNAGTGTYGDPFDEDTASVRRTLAVNLEAPLLLSHALFARLQSASGRLVLIGSVARTGSANLAAYAASKGGLDALARALGEEWRGRVAVSMIHPGPIATGMHEKAGFDPKGLRRFFASPERMAAMVERAVEAGRSRAVLGSAATLAHLIGSGMRR
ncbi:SDR family oxidoreductase [Fulvimarina sp. 2208YS6-2-32]|uniref:SDR family oxidoreductase n=1 Tax=Fulvimarina uroteuthidis TaxID=3098149 RepID=A0ABU5I1R5_9HYPH|nr:SDR family oxidoreductase [Fulvimarina sp. 2208YS6-2-32]MDY8109322.1 SDR family oxidoreductase [Fulvimarina sp. 2208YS6-2-32]